MGDFKPKYLDRVKENRDRFQVEFNQEERELFNKAQLFINQAKDATAIKQLAFLGWFALSNQDSFNRYFRDTLLKNERNNKRLGVVPELEINNKIQRLKQETGWKMQPGGLLDE